MHTSKRQIFGLTALVLAAVVFMMWLAGLLHLGKISPGTVAPPAEAPPGRLHTVATAALPVELTVLAQVMSPTLAQVSAQVPGRVAKTHVEPGDRVAAGAALVTLDAREFQARVKQAQAGAAQARAHLTQAEADFQRYRRLKTEGAISPQEFDAVEARLRAAQAALAQAQAQVQEAATMSGYTVIKAPQAGVVAERRVAAGDLAQPGQPLLVLYDPARLRLEGQVNDSHRQAVHAGLKVRAEAPAVGWQGETTLAEIFPMSQAASRTLTVRTDWVSAAGLAPGMFARLTIPIGQTTGILIPKRAVRQVGQLAMVEVFARGRTFRRQVQLGRTIGEQVEVLAGLQPGEQVALLPE
jgi:RND family efflux transporter MFP subunit